MQLSEQEREAVIDTIMGEARGEGYLGMAAVAKAIANRSEVRGISMAQAVGQKSQFDGASYSAKSKDSKERAIAEAALDAVLSGEDPAQIGAADHFAANGTKTGWTNAFADTAKTIGGHTFYSSPEAVSLAQYSGITAAPQAKPGMPFEAVLGAPSSELRGRAADVAAAAAIAQPDGLLSYDLAGKTRDQPITDDLQGIIERAVQATGPDLGFTVTSGGQDKKGTVGASRTGSTRHDNHGLGGRAADGKLTRDGMSITPAQNMGLYETLARQAGVQGALGLGHYGWGVHIDNARPGVWGPSTTSRDLNPAIRDAFNEGKAVREAGLYSATGPTAKPGMAMDNAGLTNATAVGVQGAAPNHSASVSANFGGMFGPSKSSILDGYREYANSRSGPAVSPDVFGAPSVAATTATGLPALDAPVDIAARPEVMGPSFDLSGVTATPSSKPGKEKSRDPNELSTLGKAAFGVGLMTNAPMAIGGLALSNLANGRPINAGMGFGLGSKLGGLGGLGGLFGGFDGSPSVGTSALDYATGRALGNPNYTGMDFSRDFTNMGGMISNGRAAPGMVTAAEFNAAQRDAGLAMGIMEGFSRDFGSAFGGLGGLGGNGSSGGNAGGKSSGKGGSSGRGGGKDESGKSGADGR